MPTNRQKRMRSRRSTDIDAAMEELFTTGKVSDGADCWDLWNRPLVYETWYRVRDKGYKAGWLIFETEGDECCFKDFSWIDREDYQKWKADNAKVIER